MRPFVDILLLLSLTGFLVACSSGEKHARFEPLMTIPSQTVDPGDEKVIEAIEHFLAETGAPASSIYSFRRYDLNGDNRRDALVLFKNPYGYWCGLYGCTMLVLKAGDENFQLVSTVQTVREPIFISDLETNGWKNIVIHVSGRWAETKDVALQFDGGKYPGNPSDLPSYLQLASSHGRKLFYD